MTLILTNTIQTERLTAAKTISNMPYKLPEPYVTEKKTLSYFKDKITPKTKK